MRSLDIGVGDRFGRFPAAFAGKHRVETAEVNAKMPATRQKSLMFTVLSRANQGFDTPLSALSVVNPALWFRDYEMPFGGQSGIGFERAGRR